MVDIGTVTCKGSGLNDPKVREETGFVIDTSKALVQGQIYLTALVVHRAFGTFHPGLAQSADVPIGRKDKKCSNQPKTALNYITRQSSSSTVMILINATKKLRENEHKAVYQGNYQVP